MSEKNDIESKTNQESGITNQRDTLEDQEKIIVDMRLVYPLFMILSWIIIYQLSCPSDQIVTKHD
jgi:hypothetical protein